MDLITKDSETTQVLFSSLDRVLENLEHIVTNYRPVLNGEHYLTGRKSAKGCASVNGLCRIIGTRGCWATCNFREKSFIVKVTSGIYWIGITGNEILKTCYLGILIA